MNNIEKAEKEAIEKEQHEKEAIEDTKNFYQTTLDRANAALEKDDGSDFVKTEALKIIIEQYTILLNGFIEEFKC